MTPDSEQNRECPNDGVEMDLFGPPLSGPWYWVCPTCGHREPSGIETAEERLFRKLEERKTVEEGQSDLEVWA